MTELLTIDMVDSIAFEFEPESSTPYKYSFGGSVTADDGRTVDAFFLADQVSDEFRAYLKTVLSRFDELQKRAWQEIQKEYRSPSGRSNFENLPDYLEEWRDHVITDEALPHYHNRSDLDRVSAELWAAQRLKGIAVSTAERRHHPFGLTLDYVLGPEDVYNDHLLAVEFSEQFDIKGMIAEG